MTVKLIAHTKPIAPEFGATATEFIAYVARVSNPNNQWNHDTAVKLVDYLERNSHWSPFEMYNIVLEINTTRDIARQILRHRSFSFQEFSQRYAEAEDGYVEREARFQDPKNRQNSIEDGDQGAHAYWFTGQREVFETSHRIYKQALEAGIAKEVARAVLPEGLTPSRLYVNGNVRSWLHYLLVRLDPSTQKEHREIAKEVEVILRSLLTSSP